MNVPGLRTALLLLTLGVLAIDGTALEAQRGPRRGGRNMQDREELMQRIRARFGEMIREELGLDEEEAQALGEAVRATDEERRELTREEQAVRRRVEALMLEGGEDEAEARELLGRMRALRAREAELFAEEQARLLEILSPVQVLRFMALRDRMAQRIRALTGEGRRGRGPGGPGSTPPLGSWLPDGAVPPG